MIPTVKQFAIAMVLFVLVDSVWLLTVGQLAVSMTEAIQGSPVTLRWLAALVVYIALGYLIYQTDTVLEAGLMGTAVYAVYDFTNYTILKKYDGRLAVADSLWGGVLFATVKGILSYIK